MAFAGQPCPRRGRRQTYRLSRIAAAACALVALAPSPASAQATIESVSPGAAGTARAGPVLGLAEAVALAREDQPSLAALERDATASEQAAVAARSLPDPQLSGGVQNYPVTGNIALNPTRDEMTMYTIGIMREQVRRSRREAEAARLRAEALVSRAEGSTEQRRIEREVMIAWIDAVEAAAKQRLLVRIINDLNVGREIMESGVNTGASTPALALQARAEVALAEAQLAEARGSEARARAMLGRRIGAAAQRALPERIPNLVLPEADADSTIETHPQIRLAEAREAAARRQVDAARSERRPNISWSLMYGWRPDYGDMVTAQVTIPLQINRRGLQDRRIAEDEARADAARLRIEDAQRELSGAHEAALADYRSASAQLAILLDQAIPSLEASFAAAEARYAGGQGSLELPLNIVRRYVEVNIQSVEQQARRARAAAELIYLSAEAGQ